MCLPCLQIKEEKVGTLTAQMPFTGLAALPSKNKRVFCTPLRVFV